VGRESACGKSTVGARDPAPLRTDRAGSSSRPGTSRTSPRARCARSGGGCRCLPGSVRVAQPAPTAFAASSASRCACHGLAEAATSGSASASCLKVVGLPQDAASRYPHSSRAASASAIGVARPRRASTRTSFVADEPVSALTSRSRHRSSNLSRSCRGLPAHVPVHAHDLAVVPTSRPDRRDVPRHEIVESPPAGTICT